MGQRFPDDVQLYKCPPSSQFPILLKLHGFKACQALYQRAEKAWAILGEIAILSQATIVFSDTGKAFPEVLMLPRDEDLQLVSERRTLLRFLHEAVQAAERRARVQQFSRC